MIKVIHFYAVNDEELEAKLNELVDGRIIRVETQHDDRYEVIYEEPTNSPE